MKPKSEDEAQADTAREKDLIKSVSLKNLVLRLTLKNGKSLDVDLPVEKFSDLSKMEVVTE